MAAITMDFVWLKTWIIWKYCGWVFWKSWFIFQIPEKNSIQYPMEKRFGEAKNVVRRKRVEKKPPMQQEKINHPTGFRWSTSWTSGQTSWALLGKIDICGFLQHSYARHDNIDGLGGQKRDSKHTLQRTFKFSQMCLFLLRVCWTRMTCANWGRTKWRGWEPPVKISPKSNRQNQRLAQSQVPLSPSVGKIR